MKNSINDSQVAGLFPVTDASSIVVRLANQIAAPVIKANELTDDELFMGGGVRVLMFVLDKSPSMDKVADQLKHDFNNILIPAIEEAREDDISALRIGGLAFNSSVDNIWEKKDSELGIVLFHKLNELPRLTDDDYYLTGGTALYDAVIEATAKATAYAVSLEDQYGMDVDVDIIILSDGDDNSSDNSRLDMKQIIQGRKKDRVRYAYFFFETYRYENLPDKEREEAYRKDAIDMGFDPEFIQVFLEKEGETEADRKKRFRVAVRVISKTSASKATSVVVATSAVINAGLDDDIV